LLTHQNPKAIIPTPIKKLKKPDSIQVPISKPMPNVIKAQPHSWFFLHIKTPPAQLYAQEVYN
jgi:hypothetical protein